MASHTASDFFAAIDAKYALFTNAAAAGMSNYVIPIAWAGLAIALLVYALMIVEGKVHSPMEGWITKGLGIVLILTAAGPYYSRWVGSAVNAVPNGMSAAIGNVGDPNMVLNALAGNLLDLIAGIGSGSVDAFANWNIGGGLLLGFAMIDVVIVGTLLLVACAFNLLYAKMGLALLLAVGPFFIIVAMWSPIRHWFHSWLNTLLYLIFLHVMSVLFVVFFIGVGQMFMDALKAMVMTMTAAGGAKSYPVAVAEAIKAWATGTPTPASVGAAKANFINIVRLVIEMNFVFIPMFLVALEMRTLVSSMTSGSGGSAGSGIARFLRRG